MLASTSRNLSSPSVHAGADKLPEFPGPDAPGSFLHLVHGPLQISSPEDHTPALTCLYHRIRIREHGGDRLVHGNPFHPGLSACDHRFLHVFDRRHHRRNIGNHIPQHLRNIPVKGRHSKTLAYGPETLRMRLDDGDHLRIRVSGISFGVYLPHATTADNGYPVFVRAHDFLLYCPVPDLHR